MIHIRRWGLLTALFFFFFIVLLSHSRAGQEIFYSHPTPDSSRLAKFQVQPEFPLRRFYPLNGQWSVHLVKDTLRVGQVNVPFSYRGRKTFIFQKNFQFLPNPKKKYYLNFNGLNGDYFIKLNGNSIFRAAWNFLPIRLPVSATYLLAGKNSITIELIPVPPGHIDPTRWFPINIPRVESGIVGPVYLEEAPVLALSQVQAAASLSRDTLRVRPRFRLLATPAPLVNFNITVQVQNGGRKVVSARVNLDSTRGGLLSGPEILVVRPKVWAPQNPRKTLLKVLLDSAGVIVDEVVQPLAVRGGIAEALKTGRLSGNAIRGINYVYQDTRGTTLFNPKLALQDLLAIRKRGYNAVRVIFSPLPEKFYQLSDSLGILSFQDLPFLPDLAVSENRGTLSNWQRQYSYLVRLAKRHPSLAAIGVGFFTDGDSHGSATILKNFLTVQTERPVPLYISTAISPPDSIPGIDFRFLELVRRNHPENLMTRLRTLRKSQRIFLSGYSKAMSYRVDSTTVTFDQIQLLQLARSLKESQIPAKFPGSFIPTYNNYYLNFPSVQNGGQGTYYLNRMGLVNLNRESNPTLPSKKYSGKNPGFISEARSSQSYIYIITGIINLFIFFFFYRKFIDFRQSLHHSIKKPHGFFINLQERIIIPYGQSTLLLLVIALNGAIVLSSLSFFFRNNLIFDYLLSLLFFSPALKQFVSEIIWHQTYFIGLTSLLIVVLFLLMALPIKVLSLFGESRVPFRQALAVSIWSASPFVFLLPLGIFLYNLLLTMNSYWILIGLLLYFHVWFLFRWVNGSRVLTNFLYSRVLLIYSGAGLILAGGIFYFYQQQVLLIEHLRLVIHLFSRTI